MATTSATGELLYGWESSYGSASTDIDKIFGLGQSVITYRIDEGTRRGFGLGLRYPTSTFNTSRKIDFEVEAILANPWWAKSLLGAVSTGGSYTHTFTVNNAPPSMTINTGAGGYRAQILGMMMDSMTLTCNQGEPAMIRLSMMGGNTSMGTASLSATQETLGEYTFANGTFKVGGVADANVSDCEIRVVNNALRAYVLGQAYPTAMVARKLDIEVTATVIFSDDTWHDRVIGGTEVDIDLNFINAGSEEIKFDMENFKVSPYSLRGLTAESDLVAEEITLIGEQIQIVAENSVSAVP